MLVGLLTSFTKHRYSINVVIVWFAIPVLIYIPNYYFSGPLEKRKAVIEKYIKEVGTSAQPLPDYALEMMILLQ